jgi:glycerate dehydrogenase
MQIVVLDGHTLNPGDLSWAELEQLGEVRLYPRTPPDQIVPRAAEAQAVLTNKTVLAAQTLAQLPQLRYIGVLATGYNIVDVEAARAQGILVANVPTYGTQSVAQMVFAHVLNLGLHVADHARTVRDGRWCQTEDFCYWDYPLLELAGRTLGLIGLGRIGQATAQLGLAFGMQVIAHDPQVGPSVVGVRRVDLEQVFRDSDVLSLHCPLTPQTQRLVDRPRLALMKPTAILINTSRGPLVDEQALADALNAGRLAGAGLDVLAVEPPRVDNPLLSAKNCVITPHIAWATKAARQRLLDTVVDNLRAFLAGRPQHVVNLASSAAV